MYKLARRCEIMKQLILTLKANEKSNFIIPIGGIIIL